MHATNPANKTAVETFANHTEMSEREAEVFVLREVRGVRRGEAAAQLDISENTVDNHYSAAKEKARLPDIMDVNRQYANNTGLNEGSAYEIRFPNGAMLRYVWNTEQEEIREQTVSAADPHSIYEDMGVGGSEDELAEFALESICEYTQNYRDNFEACRKDWTPIFEALTGWAA